MPTPLTPEAAGALFLRAQRGDTRVKLRLVDDTPDGRQAHADAIAASRASEGPHQAGVDFKVIETRLGFESHHFVCLYAGRHFEFHDTGDDSPYSYVNFTTLPDEHGVLIDVGYYFQALYSCRVKGPARRFPRRVRVNHKYL